MTSLLRHQFVRFVLVGCMNTAFSYGLYAAFLWCGLNFVVANGLAFVISLLFSFRTQGILVFRNADPRLLLRFVLVWAAIYLVNIALIGGLMRLGLSAYLAGAVALVPVTLLSYLLQSFAVFGGLSRPAEAEAARPTP
jgi:putative flippase GtrA